MYIIYCNSKDFGPKYLTKNMIQAPVVSPFVIIIYAHSVVCLPIL